MHVKDFTLFCLTGAPLIFTDARPAGYSSIWSSRCRPRADRYDTTISAAAIALVPKKDRTHSKVVQFSAGSESISKIPMMPHTAAIIRRVIFMAVFVIILTSSSNT